MLLDADIKRKKAYSKLVADLSFDVPRKKLALVVGLVDFSHNSKGTLPTPAIGLTKALIAAEFLVSLYLQCKHHVIHGTEKPGELGKDVSRQCLLCVHIYSMRVHMK